MRAENFLYFATVSGFFIGIIFSLLHGLDFMDFIYVTIIFTMLFYIISLASISFFIKFHDVKKRKYLEVEEIESIIDIQVDEIEKYENFIFDSYQFIKAIEQEELEFIKKNRK